MNRKTAFAPVIAPDAQVLVLGSLPGDASLAAGRYYAHPRNQFWAIMGAVIGRDLVAMAYEDRLAALGDARVGLWDTVASAQRPGSLDTAMRDVAAAALESLMAGLPHLRAVGFMSLRPNGGTAARIGRGQLRCENRSEGRLGGRVELIDLPSTSPAYCAVTIAQKQQKWNLLRKFLD